MPKMRKTTIAKALRERAEELTDQNYHTAASFLEQIADGIENGTLKTATDVAQLAIKTTEGLN